jgi:hypothetical protein
VTIPGEGTHARSVQELLRSGREPAVLAAAGVTWLVVESDTAGDMGDAARTVDALTPTYRDGQIAVYWIGGHTDGMPASRVRATLIAHWAWLALLLISGVGGAGAVLTGWRRRDR